MDKKPNFYTFWDDSGVLDEGAHVISGKIFGEIEEEKNEFILESPIHESTEKKLK